MAQVDDERAVRALLADLTADQPPAPAGRYGAVRRRAAAHRRRQLAGAAAVVAVLVAAAIAIPLGVLRAGPRPPQAKARHYHMSLLPPSPHAQRDVIATGVLGRYHWTAVVQLQRGDLCWGATFGTAAGLTTTCVPGPAPTASAAGEPVAAVNSVGAFEQIDIGSVRSDVAYVTISYNDGQLLTARPVAVFGSRYARWFALPAPGSAAVTQITAYSKTGELGYAIPFTAAGTISLSRWLRPGQPALPRPVTAVIGSGRADGSSWRESVYVGPWGTCFAGAGNVSACSARTGWLPQSHRAVGLLGSAGVGSAVFYEYGEATPAVSYLVLTRSDGRTQKLAVAAVGARRFFAYASATRDPVVRWAAYNAQGIQVASGT
jgi:hypothetical protein